MGFFQREGSAPPPFDALDGPRLAGPDDSHPLHDVRAEELVRHATDGIDGDIRVDGRAMVGGGIEGELVIRATRSLSARGAHLRLVGLRLDEVQRSVQHRDKDGHVTSSEAWVEVDGRLFVDDAFIEPAIPTDLREGATWSGRFSVPAPRLGPPSAHLGESIIAWALQVRWDVPRARDEWLAVHLPIAQDPNLLRAGVGRQGGPSLLEAVSDGDGVITVGPHLPARAATYLEVTVRWPSAPIGRPARVELHRHSNAPNDQTGILDSVELDSTGFVDGSAVVSLLVPPDAPPSFDGAGLEIAYVVRVLIDRRFMPDLAIERPIAVT